MQTKNESIKIAIRNGINEEQAKDYFEKAMKREKYIEFLRKIGIENVLRKIIKKQSKSDISKKWYMDVK